MESKQLDDKKQIRSEQKEFTEVQEPTLGMTKIPMMSLSFTQKTDWKYFLKSHQEKLEYLDFTDSKMEGKIKYSVLSRIFNVETENDYSTWLNDDKQCQSLLKELSNQFQQVHLCFTDKIVIQRFFLHILFNVRCDIHLSRQSIILLKKFIIKKEIPCPEYLSPFVWNVLLDKIDLLNSDNSYSDYLILIQDPISNNGSSNMHFRYFHLNKVSQYLEDKTLNFLNQIVKNKLNDHPFQDILPNPLTNLVSKDSFFAFGFISLEQNFNFKNKILRRAVRDSMFYNENDKPKLNYALINLIKVLHSCYTEIDEQLIANEISSVSDKDWSRLNWHWSSEELQYLIKICSRLSKEYDLPRMIKILSQLKPEHFHNLLLQLEDHLFINLPDALERLPLLKPFPKKPKSLEEIHQAMNSIPKDLVEDRYYTPSLSSKLEGKKVGDYSIKFLKSDSDMFQVASNLDFCIYKKEYRNNAANGSSEFLTLVDKHSNPQYCIELSKEPSPMTYIGDLGEYPNLMGEHLYEAIDNKMDRLEELLSLAQNNPNIQKIKPWLIRAAKGYKNAIVPEPIIAEFSLILDELNNGKNNLFSFKRQSEKSEPISDIQLLIATISVASLVGLSIALFNIL